MQVWRGVELEEGLQVIDRLYNQCLALQAVAILRGYARTAKCRNVYDRAARHIIPVLFDDTPLGYLPKVIVDPDLIDEEATVVNTRRVRVVRSRVRTL
jgi:hypothetical protein